MNDDRLTPERAAAETLVVVTRGALVESVHRGHVAAVDGDGRLVAALGEPEVFIYLRSSCKPHQAVPLVSSGAADRFRLTAAELAIACGSHNGEPAHTDAVVSMLSKIGLTPEALRCGPHEPYGEEAAAKLQRRGEEPSPLHNNCSGKHAGMLTLARHLGAPTESYDQLSHPVQQSILNTLARFADARSQDIPHAVDGCGAPTFAVPLRTMALMGARLAVPPETWDGATREACGRLAAAMTERPEMVEGEGELDTELMRAARGRFVSKVGAEGVYLACVRPCAHWPRGLGLALMLEDGDKKDRARPVAVVEALRQSGLLSDAELSSLEKFAAPPVTNNRGETVGELRPRFELKFTA